MKENIRIAFILPSLANRGPIVFTHYLIEALNKKVNLIDVYYFDDLKEIEFSCKCVKINKISDIKFDKYDVVQSTMFRPDVFLALYKLTHKNNTVIISGIHNYIKEDMRFNYGKVKGFFISKIWIGFLKLFNGVIYSSNEMIHYYNKYLKKIEYKKVSYGISEIEYKNITLDYEDEIKKLKSKYKIIGAVGLLIKRKGFHQIIKALSEIEDHALVIIGSGPEELELKKMVIEYSLEDRVIFTGFQQNSKDYYKYFDLYCLCSYSEGFGLAMLEALSVKIPLICSDLEIYNEYFTSKDVGLFEVDNIPSLVEQINRVNKSYSDFSRSSYKLYKSFFDIEKMASEHIIFYKELIK